MAYFNGVDLNTLTPEQRSSMFDAFQGSGTGGKLFGALGGAAVGAGVGLVSDVIGMVVNWNAMKRQEAENKRVERLNLNLRDQDIARDERHRGQDLGFRQDELNLDKEKFAYQKQLDTYKKLQQMLDGIAGQMNRNPQFGAALQSMWRR